MSDYARVSEPECLGSCYSGSTTTSAWLLERRELTDSGLSETQQQAVIQCVDIHNNAQRVDSELGCT